DGVVLHKANPDRSVPYASLAEGKKVAREISGQAPAKHPEQYTIVGQSVPRVDVPLKVNGSVKYGYDVVAPGMVHGKIVRPPSLGASLESIDFGAAEQMPGVVGVFREGNLAGLAAERLDQAQAALAAVKVSWKERQTGNTSENIFNLLKRTPD